MQRRFREAILDDSSPGDAVERPAPSPLRSQYLVPQQILPRSVGVPSIPSPPHTPNQAVGQAEWRARTASEEEAASPIPDASRWGSAPPANDKLGSSRMSWGRIGLVVITLLATAMTMLLLQRSPSSGAVVSVTGPIKCTYAGLAELKGKVHARRYRGELKGKAADQELDQAKRMWEMHCKPQRSTALRWSRNHDEL